jgi:predicted transcriptional regulator
MVAKGMKHEPDIFDKIDAKAEAESHARGIADLDAGRTVTHEAVVKWLQSWGTGNRLPRPKVGD